MSSESVASPAPGSAAENEIAPSTFLRNFGLASGISAAVISIAYPFERAMALDHVKEPPAPKPKRAAPKDQPGAARQPPVSGAQSAGKAAMVTRKGPQAASPAASSRGTASANPSVITATQSAVSEIGVAGLCRGVLRRTVTEMPHHVVTLVTYDELLRLSGAAQRKEEAPKTLIATRFCAAGAGGALATLTMWPYDRMRALLMQDVRAGIIPSSEASVTMKLRQIFTAEGVRGVFSGAHIAVLQALMYRGMLMAYYFGIQDRSDVRSDLNWTGWASAGAAAVSGRILGMVFSVPFEVILRTLLLDRAGPKPKLQFATAGECFHFLVRTRGSAGLYAGFTRQIPHGFAGLGILVGYERLSLWWEGEATRKKRFRAAAYGKR